MDKNHTFSWISSWCIWRNFWDTKWESYKKSNKLKNQISNLEKHLKMFEFIHLKLIIKTRIHQDFQDEISLFHFYSIQNGEIFSIQNQKSGSEQK